MRDYAALRNGQKVAKEAPFAPPENWGLNYPFETYLAMRFQIWLESGMTVYPRTGGIDEQDAALVDDFTTLLMVYRYQEKDVLSKVKDGN